MEVHSSVIDSLVSPNAHAPFRSGPLPRPAVDGWKPERAGTDNTVISTVARSLRTAVDSSDLGTHCVPPAPHDRL